LRADGKFAGSYIFRQRAGGRIDRVSNTNQRVTRSRVRKGALQ
jgi:hypothetical protein